LNPELYPGNPGLTPAWVNHRKKGPKRSSKCAFNEE